MLAPLSPDRAQRLREFFRSANFTHEQFRTNPALRKFPSRRATLPNLLEATQEASITNTLLRWFFLCVPQETDSVTGLIPEPILHILVDAGLLKPEGGLLIPNAVLTPWHDYLFAADTVTKMYSERSADAVVWPNPTTLLLQHFAIRKRCGDTLDLGAGCGIQGILAASYSDRVCATDLNPRAEEFVVFNSHLNDVTNIEYRTGDTFEPVKHRTFDLILSNPPFFVSPSADQLYCENGMELDQYCRRVVREAAGHLNDGGFFQAVLEWVRVRDEPWQQRLSEWLEGTQCDAWIIRSYAHDAASYAQQRIRTTWPDLTTTAKFDEWMAYYRERGVEEIHGGVLAMRRRSGRNWLRIEETAVNPTDSFGDTVLELFATQDVLAGRPSDNELLGMRPRLAAGAQLVQKSRAAGGQWNTSSVTLQLPAPLPAAQAVEPEVANFIVRCDGRKTLEELARELSQQVSAAPELVRQQCCAIVRRLAEQRFLHILR